MTRRAAGGGRRTAGDGRRREDPSRPFTRRPADASCQPPPLASAPRPSPCRSERGGGGAGVHDDGLHRVEHKLYDRIAEQDSDVALQAERVLDFDRPPAAAAPARGARVVADATVLRRLRPMSGPGEWATRADPRSRAALERSGAERRVRATRVGNGEARGRGKHRNDREAPHCERGVGNNS